jgi:hypothetical protein
MTDVRDISEDTKITVDSPDGYYYLKVNGELFYSKEVPDFQKDKTIKHIWVIDMSDRGNAWVIATQAGAFGAKKQRIDELSRKWQLTNTDAGKYAKRVGIKLIIRGNRYRANYINPKYCSIVGTGAYALDALTDLYKKQYRDFHGK